jgi:hypothetical protein
MSIRQIVREELANVSREHLINVNHEKLVKLAEDARKELNRVYLENLVKLIEVAREELAYTNNVTQKGAIAYPCSNLHLNSDLDLDVTPLHDRDCDHIRRTVSDVLAAVSSVSGTAPETRSEGIFLWIVREELAKFVYGIVREENAKTAKEITKEIAKLKESLASG